MRISIFFTCIYFGIAAFSSAQKPAIDFDTYKTWSNISRYELSSNGKYIAFLIENEPGGSQTLIIKPTNNKWEKQYIGATFSGFTYNNNSALITKSGGKLVELNLKTKNENDQPVLPLRKESPEPVSIQRSDIHENRIIIKSLFDNQIDSIDNVSSFMTAIDQSAVIINVDGIGGQPELYWYDFKSHSKSKIWEGHRGQKVEFSHEENCNYNLFKCISPLPEKNTSLPEVDIWSYRDANFPDPFTPKGNSSETFFSVSCNKDHFVTKLTSHGERLISAKGDYALVEYRPGKFLWEAKWNENAKATIYCISMANGRKTVVATQSSYQLLEAKISPDGRYIIMADNNLKHYISYDTKNETSKIISKRSEILMRTLYSSINILPFETVWVDSSHFAIRDDNDIWMFDASGKEECANLTKSYGKDNHLSFRFSSVKYLNKFLLLSTFDEVSKNWGFYRISLTKRGSPEKLSMGDYYFGGNGPLISKAEKSNTYVIVMEKSNESPNLFITNDFIKFQKVSNNHPEKKYNWMKAELITWERPDKVICKGILYKPEDLDSTKKYPLVVSVYDSYTEQINAFIKPNEYSTRNGYGNWLPAAWLVSNRYLVFIPDMENRKEDSILYSLQQTTTSGIANLINKFHYINKDKIGIQGSSWGGELVNYIVSHTTIFAAAFSGAGFTDQISRSGFSDAISTRYYLPWVEGQEGGSLTDVPQRYIDESALFAAGKIKTPLLIKHNKDDGAVPFYQGLQFFRLLRRLNKKAWLLQYDGGGHGVNPGKNLEDFNIRLMQFFNYYLKDSLPPIWMTSIIPSELKQTVTGLELDSTGKYP